MLVLSRKKDEKIIIGDKITIMVIEIRGDKVRLGIDAPKDVTVHRQEVYEAIKKEHDDRRNFRCAGFGARAPSLLRLSSSRCATCAGGFVRCRIPSFRRTHLVRTDRLGRRPLRIRRIHEPVPGGKRPC